MPAFVFALDISSSAISSGFFHQAVNTIKQSLDYLVNGAQTDVTFMTFDQQMQFYSLPQDPNGEPSILIVADVDDPFSPAPRERLMLNAVQDRERIDAFLDKLLTMYQTEDKISSPMQTCAGAAVSAAISVLEGTGGRVILCQSGSNTMGAGPLKSRDNVKEYN